MNARELETIKARADANSFILSQMLMYNSMGGKLDIDGLSTTLDAMRERYEGAEMLDELDKVLNLARELQDHVRDKISD